MQEIKDDILERTNQMISLCRNADTSANETVITLADQGEQLMNIETHLSTIDATLIDTKQNINRLKGITRRVIDTCRTKFHRKIISKIMLYSTKKQKSLSSSSTPPPPPSRRRQSNAKLSQQNISASNSFIDGQIDEALYEIDNLLHSLKDKAYIINDQLVGQADRLDHIRECMKESTGHIQEQNTYIQKLNQ